MHPTLQARYQQQLHRLYSQRRTSSQRTLDDIRSFLARMTHFRPPIVLQIVGTNGKGSTASFVEHMFRHAGYTTGLFTSPHLHHFEERIRLDGCAISPQQLAPLLDRLWSLLEHSSLQLPFFDLALALAWMVFQETHIDVAIIEAGMGGARDASTALPVDTTLLTSVGLDHQIWLGESLEAIALEKAGAFRPQTPVWIGRVEAHIESLLRTEAQRIDAGPVYSLERDFSLCSSTQEAASWRYMWHPHSHCLPASIPQTTSIDAIQIQMQGDIQRDNFALATSAFLHLSQTHSSPGAALSIESIREAVRWSAETTSWPGRMQIFSWKGVSVWVDGAHNPQAIEALVRNVPSKPIHLILGCASDKPLFDLVRPLLPQCQSLHFCAFQQPRSIQRLNVQRALQHVPNPLPSWDWSSHIEEALQRAFESHQKDAIIVVTGSLFLVAEALSILSETS